MNFKFNYDEFKDELAKHFNNEHHVVTEDLIRYWFIHTHSKMGNGDPFTEIPYVRNGKTPLIHNVNKPSLSKAGKSRARADLYYGDIDSGDEQDGDEIDSVFEFKYHRRTRYSDCCTGTDCGSVFGDLNRLSILENRKKYFVYVFDKSMGEYYKKKIKKYSSAFEIFKDEKGKLNSPKNILVGKNFDGVLLAKDNPRTARYGFGEIVKGAFSQFRDDAVFSQFNYKVKVLYSGEILDKKFNITKADGTQKGQQFYLLICQVLDSNSNQTKN